MKTTKDTASVIKMADSLRLRDAAEAQMQQADRREAEAEAEAKAAGLNVQDVISEAYRLVYGETSAELTATA